MYPSTGRWAKCLKGRQRRSTSTGGNKLNDSRNLDVSVLPYQSISVGSEVFMHKSIFSYNECALEDGRKWLIFMQKPLGNFAGRTIKNIGKRVAQYEGRKKTKRIVVS